MAFKADPRLAPRSVYNPYEAWESILGNVRGRVAAQQQNEEKAQAEQRDFERQLILKQIDKRQPMIGGQPATMGQISQSPQDVQFDIAGGTEAQESETKLREEYLTKGVGDYPKIRDSFTRIVQSAKKPSAAGDLALIFNYMKLLDPGSVVRESEFATAQNAAGVPARTRAMWNRVLNGERLSKETRGDFLNKASDLYSGMAIQFQQANRVYKTLANEYGLKPERVVVDIGLPKLDEGMVEVISSDGEIGTMSETDFEKAKKDGFRRLR